MALDIYFRENIARVLAALNAASGSTAALIHEQIASTRPAENTDRQLANKDLADHVRIYRQGYRDALAAVATAFGVLSVPPTEPSLDGLEPHDALYERVQVYDIR